MKLSDLAPWRDPWTGMILAKDGGNDNLATCTATALQFLDASSKALLRPIVDQFFKGCEIERGLYSRRPGDRGEGSADNVVGLMALAYGLDLDYRFDLVWYAEAHDWTFNVEQPGEGSLKHNYGKFVGIPPFMEAGISRALPLADQVILGGAAIVTSFSDMGDTSNKCLQILINQVVKERYALLDLSLWAWKRLMMRKYPDGQRGLYEVYWGKDHPYTLASPIHF